MSVKRYSCSPFSIGEEAELAELLVGAGEILDVDLDVVAVIVRDRPVGLAEEKLLVRARLDMRAWAAAIRVHLDGAPMIS